MVDPTQSTASVEQRLEFETLIADISASLLATPLPDIDAAVLDVVRRVREFFHADRAAILEVDADRDFARVSHASYGDGISQVSGDINLARLFPWGYRKVVLEGQPLGIARVADLSAEAALDRSSWEAMQTRSCLHLPISVEERITHLIVIHTVHEEREWPDSFLPRLLLLGQTLVSALARKRSYDAIRVSEARLDLAAASAGAGLWELDAASGSIWATPEARRLYGLGPEEEATLERFMAIVHPDHREEVTRAIDESVRNGEPFAQQYRIVLPDDTIRWIQANGRAGEGSRLLGVSQDVTERVLALDEVQRLRDELQRENTYLRQEASARLSPDLIVGRSPAIRRAVALAEQVAATDSTVLLLGETGTGKERFASFIHESSRRRDRTMIRVNCSAIPSALIESELFGREKGAYTGALSRQVGRFELANASTIFLDEIGDLPAEVQVKLLRTLEERTIERLGSPQPLPVDVRIIAATHRDLEEAVREGTFRGDLFYRLNVFPIGVPPLRDRRDDIPELVNTFVAEFARAMGKRVHSVTPESMAALVAHAWPGNVRELRNVIERAMILATGPTLCVDVPPSPAGPARPTIEPVREAMADVERSHLMDVLARTGWRIRGKGGAAEVLGLKPTTLEYRMARLGIRRPSRP